jgi:hypothetical protein
MTIDVSHIHKPIDVLLGSCRLQLIHKSLLFLLWSKCLNTPITILRSTIYGTESGFRSNRDEFLGAIRANLFDLRRYWATNGASSRTTISFSFFSHGNIYE